MRKKTDQLEREFLCKALGDGTPGENLNSLRRRYYASVGFVNSTRDSLSEIEDRWLNGYISANELTPAENASGKWRQMASLIGATPSKYINENKRLFYIGYIVAAGGDDPQA